MKLKLIPNTFMKLKLIPNTFMKLKMTSSTIAVLILTLTIKGVLDLTRKKKLNSLVTHHLNTTTNLKILHQKKLVIAVSCSAVLWNPSKNVIAWREDAPQLLSIWKSAGMLILILFLDIVLYSMII